MPYERESLELSPASQQGKLTHVKMNVASSTLASLGVSAPHCPQGRLYLDSLKQRIKPLLGDKSYPVVSSAC